MTALSSATGAAPNRTSRLPWLRDLCLRSVAILLLLVAWEAIARAGLVHPFLLPPLDEVAGRLVGDVASLAFFANAWLTLYRALIGFACATLIGVPIGILIAQGGFMRWFCDPLVSMGLPMPKIAFLPIFMLWFGLYDLSKIVMIAFAAIFAIIAAAEAGTAGVDKYLVWSARSLGAGRIAVFFQVILPASLPQILTGLQVALPTALITAVAAEMLMGGSGLGGAMLQSGRYADSVGVYGGIIETAAVGMLVVNGMARLRRRLLAWHAEAGRA
jgi:ABC-type nitrate/sulfonate/bicarbonate transport system permease component